MNKAQWKAMFDYCRENACTKHELLEELKANGTVDENDSIDNLSDYTEDNTYAAMRRFLEENI